MSPVDPRILEKVKKLLALSGSPEPHEAALALQRAQELMAQHGLTAEQAEVGEVVEEALRSIATASRVKGWELRLLRGVGDAFGCALLFQRGRRFWQTNQERYGTYIFVGPRAEAALCRYAGAVLQRQLNRARARFVGAMNDDHRAFWSKGEKAREVDAYCTGWVLTALEKVSPLVPSAAQKKLVEEKVKSITDPEAKGPKLNERHGSRESLARGLAEGAEAQLHRPMNGSEDDPDARALPGRR